MSTEHKSPVEEAEQPTVAKPAVATTDYGDQLVTVRRAPSIPAFGISGAVLGVIAAFILAFAFTPTEMITMDYSRSAVLGVLLVVLGAIGATLGIVLALVLDRRSAQNPETVRAIEAPETDSESTEG